MKVRFKDIFGEDMEEDLEDFIVRNLKFGSGCTSRGRIEDLQDEDEVERLRTVFSRFLVSMIVSFHPDTAVIQALLNCGPFEFVNEEPDEPRE